MPSNHSKKENFVHDKKVFIRWINCVLASSNCDQSIENFIDLIDGCALINVLEFLTNKRIDNVHVNPTTKTHQNENIQRILQFLSDESVELDDEIGENEKQNIIAKENY